MSDKNRGGVESCGGMTTLVSASFTRPNDTSQYSAGDVVADATSGALVMTFADCARYNGASGLVVSARLIDGANQTTKGSFELWLFDTAPTMDQDNAVFTPTDSELLNLVAIIPFTTAYVGDATSGAGGNASYPGDTVNRLFKCGAASTDLYGVLVVRNAYTPVAQETFAIRLAIVQD